MAVFPISYVSQPQHLGVRIRGGQLTNGMFSAHNLLTKAPFDSTRGRPAGTPTSGVSHIVTPLGKGVTFSAASDKIALDSSYFSGTGAGVSFSVLYVGRAPAGTFKFAGATGAGSDNYCWGMSSSFLRFTLTGVVDVASTLNWGASGEMLAVVCSLDRVSGSKGVTFYVKNFTTGSCFVEFVADANTPGTSANTPTIGSRNTSDFGWMGALLLDARWGRALTQAEGFALVRNPWQIFDMQPQRYMATSTAAAAGGFFSRYYYDMNANSGVNSV